MKTLLTRQPLFDAEDHVAGFELLCRGSGSAEDEAVGTAAQRVLVDALLGVGLDRLTDGRAAFVSLTRELLLGDALRLLDPLAVVLQLHESVPADDAVVAACDELAGAGYRFALDHYGQADPREPLLRFAHYVKIDVLQHDDAALAALVAQLRAVDVQLIAEKVESRSMHQSCLALGFRLFQGYLYSRPEAVEQQDVPVEHLRTLELMNLVRDMNTRDAKIEEVLSTDVALSYKILRIVNSAAVGGNGIRSMGHAVRMLGRESLYRWLSLLLVPGADQQSGVQAELVSATLLRARFCEVLGEAGRRPLAGGTLFLIGLLSSLETFYRMDLEATVGRLDLAPEVTGALIGRRGPFGAALALAAAYEQGQWDEVSERCEELGIDDADLTNLYLDALTWAHERAQAMETDAAAA
jgi:EAL and modified HD-GYP domain-containing signal transduction protein